MLSTIEQDMRYAIRALRKSPGFAAIAILSLALGIGANTAIFSLIDAVMLKSLPVSHPEELLQVTMGKLEYYSNPVWEQIRERQDVFADVFAYGRWRFNLATGGEARNVPGAYVSGLFFETLGVRAALGRTLTPADDQRGCPGAAVLSYGFWQREYGGSGDVAGKMISLDSHAFEIVGVTDARFKGIDVGSALDVMLPICAEKIIHAENSVLDQRGSAWLRIIGRKKTGMPARQAEARLNILAPPIFKATVPENWRVEDQDRYLKRTFTVLTAANGLSYVRTQYREALIVLMIIVAVVLLIACGNVANLLLARGAARQHEMAVRMALGSGRARLVRQLLTESLLLSGLGTAAGVLFAQWGARLLARWLSVSLELTLDARVLAFTCGIAVLTGLLFGIAPAWRGTRVSPQTAMKTNARGVVISSGGGSKFGLGKVLVIGQVALSLVLLVGAGLLLSTFTKLASLDAGFERDHVLLTTVDLRNGHYTSERRLPVFEEMLRRVRAIPGVQSASASNLAPIGLARWNNALAIEGYTAKSREDVTVYFNEVSDGYFATLGTALLAGRDFSWSDRPTSPPVAIVNQTMAKKYFGAASALGKHFRIQEASGLSEPLEIVGVVKDAKYGGLREAIAPTAYTAWRQDPTPYPLTNFEVRAAGGAPAALIAGVKSAIAEVNRNVSLEFTTLAIQVNESLARERILATLGSFFGALALLLAAIGLYGVMSYNVARRRNEIGLRMALGAEQARVLKMVLGEVGLLIGAGVVVGMGAAWATTRFMGSLLYGVKPNDPLTLAGAVAFLATVAVVAGYVPARRAARVDPMSALREE